MLFEKKKEKNCIEDLLLNMKYSIFILTTIYKEIFSFVPPILLMRKLRLKEVEHLPKVYIWNWIVIELGGKAKSPSLQHYGY